MTAAYASTPPRTAAEGLALASGRDYGAVISDMGRRETGGYRYDRGPRPGRALRASGERLPLLMFTSGRAIREHGAEARAAAPRRDVVGVDLMAFLRGTASR